METFQQVMNWFFVGLVVVAGGIGFWFFKKRKENSQ